MSERKEMLNGGPRSHGIVEIEGRGALDQRGAEHHDRHTYGEFRSSRVLDEVRGEDDDGCVYRHFAQAREGAVCGGLA